ncbi:MAG: hypothetical protein LQ352_001970 [Teloschistes flavicans]|nr:MAG: hypothetical protein LQ352_001970 [Teloschistes flavicans]
MKLSSNTGLFASYALSLLALVLLAPTLTALPQPGNNPLVAGSSLGGPQQLDDKSRIARHSKRLTIRAPVIWPTSGWQPGDSPAPSSQAVTVTMRQLHFQALAAILPVQPAAKALEQFYAEIVNAARNEWAQQPRLPGFVYESNEHGFQFIMRASGDLIPWDLVAVMADRLWRCAALGLPYLLDLTYGSPDRRIMVQVSLRLAEAALSAASSSSFTWSTDPNGLPDDDLLRSAREGSVESVNSGVQPHQR